MSTNVLTGDAATGPNLVQEPPEIIPATPVQAPTQVTAPQALSTLATSPSISPPSFPPSILTPPPTVESLSPVRKRKRPQSVKFVTENSTRGRFLKGRINYTRYNSYSMDKSAILGITIPGIKMGSRKYYLSLE